MEMNLSQIKGGFNDLVCSVFYFKNNTISFINNKKCHGIYISLIRNMIVLNCYVFLNNILFPWLSNKM